MGQIARLGGKLLLSSSPVIWPVKQGVEPVIMTFEMSAEDARALMERGGEVNLVVESDKRPPLVVERLLILSLMPSRNPQMTAVRVADRRWLWGRKHIIRRYNVRRRTGDFRWVGGELINIDQFEPDVEYIPPSLKGGKTPWEPIDILKDILEGPELQEKDVTYPIYTRQTNIESLEIDANGTRAIEQALEKMPGLSILLTPDSKVVVTDEISGAESRIISPLFPAVVRDMGSAIWQDMKWVRPSEIHFLFTREMEVRFDSNDNLTRTADSRFMENVLPIPDRRVLYDGKTYVQGTWVPIDARLMSAWAPSPPGTRPISLEVIRRKFAMGLLTLMYADIGELTDTANDWRARVAAIHHHFQQTYRINRRWVDRTLTIKPWRVALLDPENGTFANAPVYADYSVIPSIRGKLEDPNKYEYAYNVTCYYLETGLCRPAPALLNVIDEQVGIIRIEFADHPLGWVERYIPGHLNLIPYMDPSRPNNRMDKPRMHLKRGHKAAVIVTMIPGWPNSTTQFHRVVRKWDEFKTMLGDNSEARGPVMEVRVPPQFTARFGWSDRLAHLIEEAFGIPDSKRDISDQLSEILVNREEVKVITDAMGKAIYQSLRDRFVGEITDELNPGALPLGAISQVNHVLTEGRALTTLQLKPDLPPIDWLANVPDQWRRVLLRQVQIK